MANPLTLDYVLHPREGISDVIKTSPLKKETLSNLRKSLCFVGGLFLWGIVIV